MPSETKIIEHFADDFTLREGADPDNWPVLSATIDFTFHEPEPDVGIFGPQLELKNVVFYVDTTVCHTVLDFASAAYEKIGDDIEETMNDVATQINAQLRVWEQEIEQNNADDFDFDEY